MTETEQLLALWAKVPECRPEQMTHETLSVCDGYRDGRTQLVNRTGFWLRHLDQCYAIDDTEAHAIAADAITTWLVNQHGPVGIRHFDSGFCEVVLRSESGFDYIAGSDAPKLLALIASANAVLDKEPPHA